MLYNDIEVTRDSERRALWMETKAEEYAMFAFRLLDIILFYFSSVNFWRFLSFGFFYEGVSKETKLKLRIATYLLPNL